MHELGVTQQLLDLALQHAHASGGGQVTDLHIAIGDLSTFCEDAISFCWGQLASGTPCEGSRLHFRRIAAELTCQDCGSVHAMSKDMHPCPGCGGLRIRVTAGDDLVLESLQIEQERDDPK